MSEFKQYRAWKGLFCRKQIAELRPVDDYDITNFNSNGQLKFTTDIGIIIVSVSEPDLKNGNPRIGDMIARNPKNHKDQWLVAKDYFADNFESVGGE